MPRKPQRAARRRRAGRPSGGERDLRTHLLDKAVAVFSRRGIAATSLRAIAAAAGVTPAMLHYYFGDKDALVQALIGERLLPAVGPLRASLASMGEDPAALIAGFVHGVGQVIAQNPWLPALWVREVLCEGGALREVLFTQAIPQLPQMLIKRFATAQKRGVLNRSLDPRLLMVSLVGLTLFPAAGAPIWRRLFVADDLDAQALSRHTIALLEQGIAPLRCKQGRRP